MRAGILTILSGAVAIMYNGCGVPFDPKEQPQMRDLPSSQEQDSSDLPRIPGTPEIGSQALPGVDPIVIPNTALGAVVKAAARGSWVELPTLNMLENVFPNPSSTDCPTRTPHMVVAAWGGGAVSDEAFYIFGGGHNDYCGNEVYKFRFADLAWERITEPSRYLPCDGICQTTDGTPTSVHSYDAIQWIPYLNSLWAGPGGMWQGGKVGPRSYLLDFATKKWRQIGDVPNNRSTLSEYDPVTGLILIGSVYGDLTALNPVTGVYFKSQAPRDTGFGYNTAALDFRERQFVVMGSTTLVKSDISKVDWKNPESRIPSATLQRTFTLVEGQKVEFYPTSKGSQWGIFYDSRRHVFVAWEGLTDIWMLDSKNWIWSKVTTAAGAAPSIKSTHRGIFSRWQYLEKYDVYLGYPESRSKPWIFKP